MPWKNLLLKHIIFTKLIEKLNLKILCQDRKIAKIPRQMPNVEKDLTTSKKKKWKTMSHLI